MWRQGDVLIQRIAGIPDGARTLPQLILAEGEATGHAHRIADAGTAVLLRHAGELFLRVSAETATVVHDEHGPLTLQQGAYRFWQQREFAPALRNRVRRVRD